MRTFFQTSLYGVALCRAGNKGVVEGWLKNMNKDTNGNKKELIARLEAVLRNQVWMQ